MSWSTIQYKQKRDGVTWIILNRPEVRNAMSALMFDELNQLLLQLGKDASTRSILLTGEGKSFCAGGDLAEMKAGYGGNAGFYRFMENANRCIATLMEIDKPVVAAVNGAAMGAGMNLALVADIVIAAENAKFSEIFGNVGLIPDLGGTWLLPRLVGRAKAKELIFSYRMIDAEEALTLGLVNQVVPTEALLETATQVAEQLAHGPTFAFSMAKRLINRCYETDLHTALQMEAFAQSLSANSSDHQEGVLAFFDKRKPSFSGN